MNSRKNIGIAVGVLGLLMTCCLCPLTLESLATLFKVNHGVGLYNQVFARSALYVYNTQVICAGILALIVLVIGIVVLVQAKGNGAKTELPKSDVPSGDTLSS